MFASTLAPFGTALGELSLIVLMQTSVKALFDAGSKPGRAAA